MSKLHLDGWQDRSYGLRSSGTVEAAGRQIVVTARKPRPEHDPETAVVLATGWTAGKNAMRKLAMAAVEAGHLAISFDYTNKGRHDALASNVDDAAYVLGALPSDIVRLAAGLSMGGAVMTHALSRSEYPIRAAALIAPAQFIDMEGVSGREIAVRLQRQALEGVVDGFRHPSCARFIARASFRNCVARPAAVSGELHDLLGGTAYDALRAVKDQPDAPVINLHYGSKDPLVPAEPLLESVTTYELPFDRLLPYRGGHTRVVEDMRLARLVIDSLGSPAAASPLDQVA